MPEALSVFLTSFVSLCLAAVSAYDVFLGRYARATYTLKQRLRRWLIWFPLGLTYALFYTARYNVVAGNIPSVRESLGFASTDFGLVVTCGFWTYALTAPLMGWAADKVGGRKGVLISALGCGLSNAAAGGYIGLAVAPSRNAVAAFYALNMVFQGLGTSSIVKINSAWYHPEEIGAFSAVFNVMINSGVASVRACRRARKRLL
jgi:OPA family glycerol-3-phosphate transporter-like MFS transporter